MRGQRPRPLDDGTLKYLTNLTEVNIFVNTMFLHDRYVKVLVLVRYECGYRTARAFKENYSRPILLPLKKKCSLSKHRENDIFSSSL